ncbi:MAG: M23 family metallopeptidase, partial [Planctomycetota bacterium]
DEEDDEDEEEEDEDEVEDKPSTATPKWIDELAARVEEITGGELKADGIKPDFDNARKEIETAGANPREMLKVLKHQGGEFIAQLEIRIKALKGDPTALIEKIKAAFEAWQQKLKEINKPAPALRVRTRPADLTDLSSEDRYDYFKRVVEEVMKGTWDDADKGVNVIGVRNFRNWKEIKPGRFGWNDAIVVAFKDGETKHIEAFLATTDPADRFTHKPINPCGAIHMADGHYDYKVVEIGPKKTPIGIPDGEVKFWRDRNRDGDRQEDEKIQAARVGLRIMPGGLSPKADTWSAGQQMIAGGFFGPYKRFGELIKADPDKKFKYTLVDAGKLFDPPSNRTYLPLARGKHRIRLQAADPRLGSRLTVAYRQNEKQDETKGQLIGGFYPFGLGRGWHGGLHMHAPKGRDTVLACGDGEIVAARLGALDKDKYKFGSGNFIMLRHTYKAPDAKDDDDPQYFFSLYMHLMPLGGDEFPWAFGVERRAKLAEAAAPEADPGQQSKTAQADDAKEDEAWKEEAKKAKELVDKAKTGEVAIFEPGLVKIRAGSRIAMAASYGIPLKRQIHWEIFSPADKDPIIPADNKNFKHIEDKSETGVCKVEDILKLIDVDKDKTISAQEVIKAYSRLKTAFQLRHVVATTPSEWFIDWTSALPQSDYWKLALKDDEMNEAASNAAAYTFWDGGLATWGISEKSVRHYNPIRFLQFLIENQRVAQASSPFHMPKGPAWQLTAAAYKAKFLG